MSQKVSKNDKILEVSCYVQLSNVSSLLSKLDGNEHNSRCFFWTFDQNDSNNKPIVNLKKVFGEKKTTSEQLSVKELKLSEQK